MSQCKSLWWYWKFVLQWILLLCEIGPWVWVIGLQWKQNKIPINKTWSHFNTSCLWFISVLTNNHVEINLTLLLLVIYYPVRYDSTAKIVYCGTAEQRPNCVRLYCILSLHSIIMGSYCCLSIIHKFVRQFRSS